MPLFQNESKCENEFRMQFHFHANQSHFHKNVVPRSTMNTNGGTEN